MARVSGGVSIDTRTLQPGEVYIALRGERHDGHDFVAAALAAGAARAVVERAQLERVRHACGLAEDSERLEAVEDTLRALQARAAAARQAWNGPLIAVTGSAGKTTTKEMIAAVLATRLNTLKSGGNLNNHIGVPLTLLRLRPEHEVAVVEMGMNHAGEIAALAALAAPDVGVYTNVGNAHVGNFDSIEGVAAAKRELAESIACARGHRAPGPALVLNADDVRVAGFGAGFPGRVVMYPGRDRTQANAAAALATGELFGVEKDAGRAALAAMPPLAGRGAMMQRHGMTLIDDTYNANPEAMAHMLGVLMRTPGQRHIAVLGEMRELGAESAALHRQLGTHLAALVPAPDLLVAVAGDARFLAEGAAQAGLARVYFTGDALEAAALLQNLLRPGDTVLFKGSRAVKLESTLARVMDRPEDGPAI
jgi:UDP-N-acetylmuramoyl-tripeptide--D-alanyl-D-alanine ligase